MKLSAKGTTDTDGDKLVYKWWQYREPGSYEGVVDIQDANKFEAFFVVTSDAGNGETIHIICCEVTDDGNPPLTRYRRVIVDIK